ncbi:hypothetical protein EFL26_10955 [Nocardioides pocheonensis]|uniref:PH domain-containing protein n=2 Tax=Nocardioides pocheonensis TaxID=661485 RepID=A0A3N0GM34_9ACTN|nr:hypothetical protein EFL26_10955 [Nocardioides pocheonensis]
MARAAEADGAGTGDERSFRPTSGTALGWTGVVLAAASVVDVLVDGHGLGGVRFGLGAAIFGLLVWCFMLRPRLVIRSADLELRNPFLSWHVPLVTVRRVAVRAVTRVWTDDRRFDGVAVGRPARSLRHARPSTRDTIGLPGLGGSRISTPVEATRPQKGQLDPDMTADFVVEQILFAADQARERSQPSGTPTRSWAWPELGLLLVLVVGLVVSLLL